jgi:hypothetical protein
MRELQCCQHLHEVPSGDVDIGEFRIGSALVCHPGPTVGYRISEAPGSTLTYLPDHEPALGAAVFPSLPREWTSGASLAEESDLLIHDGQYTTQEYRGRVGWGHSSLRHMLDFATLADVKHLVPFHHDPGHSDEDIDRDLAEAIAEAKPACRVTPGREGTTLDV